MQLTGEQRVAASRQRVWDALNDPDVLRQCIPGCQSLEREADDRLAAIAEVRIGPIGARFKGGVTLSDRDAPNGYLITGQGNGGIAGSAKGSARVRLSDDGAGTLVSYVVDAEVGGRMAQLGGPIIDATAKQLAAKFFARFGEVVAGAPIAAAVPSETVAAAVPAPVHGGVARGADVPHATIWGWVAALIVAIMVGYFLGLNAESLGIVALVLVMLVIVAAAAFEAGRRGGRR